jgi:hypothetical protein
MIELSIMLNYSLDMCRDGRAAPVGLGHSLDLICRVFLLPPPITTESPVLERDERGTDVIKGGRGASSIRGESVCLHPIVWRTHVGHGLSLCQHS